MCKCRINDEKGFCDRQLIDVHSEDDNPTFNCGITGDPCHDGKQDCKRMTRGGKREGAGRKPAPIEGKKRLFFAREVSEEEYKKLEKYLKEKRAN